MDASAADTSVTSTAAAAPGKPDVKGAQSLLRALDLLEEIGERPCDLAELSSQLGLSKSTCHRLASALVQRRYLRFAPGGGYSLGPKLLDLGGRAQAQNDIATRARPHLRALNVETQDTVHLAILERAPGEHLGQVLFLEKIAGSRRFEFVSRIGERYAVAPTALGKALVLDEGEAVWRAYFGAAVELMSPEIEVEGWLADFRAYASAGFTFDKHESDPNVMCIGAPVRGAGGHIVAAISVTSTIKHMSEARAWALAPQVMRTADRIGAELGFEG